MAKDLNDWAKYWEVPFRFPKTFPLRTVNALRLAIAEPRLTAAIYRQAWAYGDDIGNEDILKTVISREGFDPRALLKRTQDHVIKEELRKNTADAERYGAFGAPSFILHRPQEPAQLFWGQDRLQLLCEALISSSLAHQKS